MYASQLAALILLAVLWLANAARSPKPSAARNVALIAVGAPLVGMLVLLYVPAWIGFFGAIRLLAVAIMLAGLAAHAMA
jgi:hypothetical protein